MVQHQSEPLGKEKKHVVFSDLKLKKDGWIPPLRSPHSNTGVLAPPFTLRPDYLTLSIPALQVKYNRERTFVLLFRWFCRHFKGGTRLEKRAGRNFFKHGYYITDSRGNELLSFHWGGQNGRLLVEIKGGGCKLLDPVQWSKIYSLAVRYKARINRFDLAGDDWEGKIFIHDEINAAYDKNRRCLSAFASGRGGKWLPRKTIISEDGDTLEFGTKDTSYFHVIYQKFRESGHTHLGRMNPRWMRWEVRFRRRESSMEIDLSIIHPNNWGAAYLGSCGHLSRLLEHKIEGRRFVHRVEKLKESTLDALVAAYTAFETQWGGFVSECSRLGLDVPCKRFSDNNTPYAALTIYDQPEILQRIASASRGALRSVAAASVDSESDDAVLF
jgi:hypothetical protein